MSLVATDPWKKKWKGHNPNYVAGSAWFKGFKDRTEDLQNDVYNCGIYFCSTYTALGLQWEALVDLFSINAVSVIGCTCYSSDAGRLIDKGWVKVYTYNSPKKSDTKLCFMIYEIPPEKMYQKGYGIYTGELKPIEDKK